MRTAITNDSFGDLGLWVVFGYVLCTAGGDVNGIDMVSSMRECNTGAIVRGISAFPSTLRVLRDG
jgi:hypothetical protein